MRATRAELFKLRCLGTPCEVGGKLDTPVLGDDGSAMPATGC